MLQVQGLCILFVINYPNRRIITFAEEEEDEITYENCGETLVVRRSLIANYMEDDSWLRNNIFHTHCTSHRRVCDVVIDGWSCENLVAFTMEKKLKLKTKTVQAFLASKGQRSECN